MSEQPTGTLASFMADLEWDDLPSPTKERVSDIVLDTVASALAGRQGDETSQIEGLAVDLGGPRDSTVIGGPPMSLVGATLLNGYQVTAVTVCDIHRPTLCHVTPEVVPPALVVAEQRGTSGRDFLVAVAAGLETTVRVGTGIDYPAMRAKGWHSPGVIGPFGGAAAVGTLLNLDAEQMRNAFGLAGSQSAGTFAHWGTPTIKFHQSRGAVSGLLAALLAEQRFAASPEILTHQPGGIFHTHSNGGHPARVVKDLGNQWELETISLRLWPAASSIQSVITAVFALIEEHDLRPEDIDMVEVGLSETVYKMHGTLPWTDKFRALLSAPYVTAVVLHDRRCWFEQFQPERLDDEELDQFARERVKVAVDPTVEGTGAVLTVRLANGQVLEDRRAYPSGDAADPLTREQIIQKYRDCADGVLAPDVIERSLEMLLHLEELSSVADLGAVLRPDLRSR